MGFPDGSVHQESVCNAGDTGNMGLNPRLRRSPGVGNGRIPRTEEPCGLQSKGSQRVRHNLVTNHECKIDIKC